MLYQRSTSTLFVLLFTVVETLRTTFSFVSLILSPSAKLISISGICDLRSPSFSLTKMF